MFLAVPGAFSGPPFRDARMSGSLHARPPAAMRAAQGLQTHREALAQAITDALYAEMPELLGRYGERGRQKCLQDMRYNLDHLAPAVELEEPRVFASYALWLNDLLRARHIPTGEVVRSLVLTERVVRERMPADEAEAVARSIRAGLAALGAEGA